MLVSLQKGQALVTKSIVWTWINVVFRDFN